MGWAGQTGRGLAWQPGVEAGWAGYLGSMPEGTALTAHREKAGAGRGGYGGRKWSTRVDQRAPGRLSIGQRKGVP